MSITLRIVLIIGSILLNIYLITSLKKMKIHVENMASWVLFTISLLILAIFPQIGEVLAGLLGIQSASNFVFCYVMVALLMSCFRLSLKMAKATNRLNALIQELALEKAGACAEKPWVDTPRADPQDLADASNNS